MKTKILLIITSILIVSAMLLSGCSQPTEAPQEQPAETQAQEQPAEEKPAAEPVTVRVWTHQNDAFNNGLHTLADAYMKENPNVTIEFETFDYDTYIQTLQTALPAGTEADVLQMFGSWVCSYADGGNLAEVPADVITKEDAQDQIFEPQISGYICSDKLYGIPQEYNIEYGAVLVNTQLAEDAGIADIENGWADWDAFIADAKKLAVVQDDVMTRAGYNFTGSDGISASFFSLIKQYGGEYLTDSGFDVNTEAGKKTLELMKRFVDEGLVDPVLFNDESNWVGDSYFEETSAIGLVGPWVIPEYAGDYPDVLKVTQYIKQPSVSEEPVFVASSGWGLTVSNNSKVQDAAWAFIKYVTLNPDNAVQWNLASGTLPALKANTSGSAYDKLVGEFPYFEPFLEILEYGTFEGHFPDRDLVYYDIVYPRVLNFLQGNATLQETLDTINKEVNESF